MIEEYRQLIRDVCTYLAVDRSPAQKASTASKPCTAPPVAPKPSLPAPPVSKQTEVQEPEAPAPCKGRDLHALVQSVCPHFRLRAHPPDDSHARSIAFSWANKIERPPVAILCDREKPPVQTMLKRLYESVSKEFAQACLVEAHYWGTNNLWEALLASPTLRVVIAPTDLLDTYPDLKRTPPPVSLIRSAPWSAMVTAPQAKTTLWNALQKNLSQHG